MSGKLVLWRHLAGVRLGWEMGQWDGDPVSGEAGDDLEVTGRLMEGLYRIGRNIDRLMGHLPNFAFPRKVMQVTLNKVEVISIYFIDLYFTFSWNIQVWE